MNSTESISYSEIGFDNNKYKELQTQAIIERAAHFKNGTLYLEIGGKFLHDPHATRVLAGFQPDIKLDIIKDISLKYEVIFCINANDIKNNRSLSNLQTSYKDTIFSMLEEYKNALNTDISVSINLVSQENISIVEEFREDLKKRGYSGYKRYAIEGYPDVEKVLGTNGYAKDEYIPHNAPLVLVLGAASNSGKLSTCLGQLYQDTQKGLTSGYAKYELFPIWNLPLNHPINLAYEAATADIGDYNAIDEFHKKAYGISAVNYNRDIDAFPIVSALANRVVTAENFIKTYKSPTDMGLNQAGYAITNNALLCKTAEEEIIRRKEWYTQLLTEGRGKQEWVEKCNFLLVKAKEYKA